MGIFELLVEVQKILHIGAPPGVDRLIRVAHNKKVLVITAQGLHQLNLQIVNVLILIDHNVLQTLLPLQPDRFLHTENVENIFNQVVVVETEALFLLIQVSPKDDVLCVSGAQILLV
ncbi:hypothetical protein SDC9_61282 [bioreactor metagenome]|uniref:Uncharacterized protein n=1 Tax=bioreactor metagenome TaxID=1076179 RepID=A0A644XGN2_9ZZZZ